MLVQQINVTKTQAVCTIRLCLPRTADGSCQQESELLECPCPHGTEKDIRRTLLCKAAGTTGSGGRCPIPRVQEGTVSKTGMTGRDPTPRREPVSFTDMVRHAPLHPETAGKTSIHYHITCHPHCDRDKHQSRCSSLPPSGVTCIVTHEQHTRSHHHPMGPPLSQPEPMPHAWAH